MQMKVSPFSRRGLTAFLRKRQRTPALSSQEWMGAGGDRRGHTASMLLTTRYLGPAATAQALIVLSGEILQGAQKPAN
jgi:hypothetical protein